MPKEVDQLVKLDRKAGGKYLATFKNGSVTVIDEYRPIGINRMMIVPSKRIAGQRIPRLVQVTEEFYKSRENGFH